MNGNFDLRFCEGGFDKKKQLRKFKESTNEVVRDRCSRKIFAPESRHKMKWAVNLYSDWCKYRLSLQTQPVEISHVDLNVLCQFSEDDLCFTLSWFIQEIKRIDGSDYPPNTLREVIIMIQMFLNKHNVFWKLLEYPKFLTLRNIIDNTMKESNCTRSGCLQV